MKAQKKGLLDLLAKQGWLVTEVEEGTEWWADEIWLLESSWSPVGGRAFVTFLVDPQVSNSRSRRKGEAVHAVLVSPNRPGDWRWVPDGFTLYFGPGWAERLPDFSAHLSALRNRGA